MKPLFFVGNRRSGTTMMTYVLNLHPHIYMASEADTLWFLFNGADGNKGLDVPLRGIGAHPDDDPANLRTKSRSSRLEGGFLGDDDLVGEIRENFFKDLLYVKDHGILNRQDAYPEKLDVELVWAGDKKPASITDPAMRPWIEQHFPDAKYIHLVRDPIHCIASMAGLAWEGGDRDFLVDYYVRLEQQALAIPDRLFVRYEDVCEDPMRELRRVCDHLELDSNDIAESYDAGGALKLKRGVVMGSDYAAEARRADLKTIPLTDELKKLIDTYGY